MNYVKLVILLCISSVISAGCAKESEAELDNIILPGLCMALECHNSTQLKIYPPASGAHLLHTGYREIGVSLQCKSCHNNYLNNPLHKNGVINGYNWIYNVRTSGEIIFPGPGVDPNMSFDPSSNNTCSPLIGNCHDGNPDIHDWYSPMPESCSGAGSCHDSSPLVDATPTSGKHSRHRNEDIGCTICHFNYFRKPIHRNGSLNGTGIVHFVFPFASYNDGTGRCSNILCHENETW